MTDFLFIAKIFIPRMLVSLSVRLNQRLSDALKSQTESAGGADGTKNEDGAVLNNIQHQLSMALRVSFCFHLLLETSW